jgi:hypothetical protein
MQFETSLGFRSLSNSVVYSSNGFTYVKLICVSARDRKPNAGQGQNGQPAGGGWWMLRAFPNSSAEKRVSASNLPFARSRQGGVPAQAGNDIAGSARVGPSPA